MSIQEQQQDRVEAQAIRPPREGVIEELYVMGSFATVAVRGDDGSRNLVELWNDEDPLESFDRLERSMWVSLCREALISKTRVRIVVRQTGRVAAGQIGLLA